MLGEARENWRRVCERIEVEQDPRKLLELVQELNRLLEQKMSRVNSAEVDSPGVNRAQAKAAG